MHNPISSQCVALCQRNISFKPICSAFSKNVGSFLQYSSKIQRFCFTTFKSFWVEHWQWLQPTCLVKNFKGRLLRQLVSIKTKTLLNFPNIAAFTTSVIQIHFVFASLKKERFSRSVNIPFHCILACFPIVCVHHRGSTHPLHIFREVPPKSTDSNTPRLVVRWTLEVPSPLLLPPTAMITPPTPQPTPNQKLPVLEECRVEVVCLVSGYEVEVGRVLLKICFLARSFAQVVVLMKRERERKKGETERERVRFFCLQLHVKFTR